MVELSIIMNESLGTFFSSVVPLTFIVTRLLPHMSSMQIRPPCKGYRGARPGKIDYQNCQTGESFHFAKNKNITHTQRKCGGWVPLFTVVLGLTYVCRYTRHGRFFFSSLLGKINGFLWWDIGKNSPRLKIPNTRSHS